jgi:hypothetical protein
MHHLKNTMAELEAELELDFIIDDISADDISFVQPYFRYEANMSHIYRLLGISYSELKKNNYELSYIVNMEYTNPKIITNINTSGIENHIDNYKLKYLTEMSNKVTLKYYEVLVELFNENSSFAKHLLELDDEDIEDDYVLIMCKKKQYNMINPNYIFQICEENTYIKNDQEYVKHGLIKNILDGLKSEISEQKKIFSHKIDTIISEHLFSAVNTNNYRLKYDVICAVLEYEWYLLNNNIYALDRYMNWSVPFYFPIDNLLDNKVVII